MEYIVKRPHQGDKWYAEGDRRKADARDVAHLVAAGVLVLPEAEDTEGEQVGAQDSLVPETKAEQPDETKGQE